jgi:multicomponent Na+:H+ antiporter subunit D
VAAITIVWGSLRALSQDDLKRRLAFSTVSQVSYIVLGVTLFGPIGTVGGLVHLIHQGIMKITMFFCAGNYAETLGLHKVSELDGVGSRMPWNTAAFTIAALGMIGVPPMAGFISKWYLGLGALSAGMAWALALLALSSLLNAAYFLPILYRAWFVDPAAEVRGGEAGWLLLGPTLVAAALSLGAGVFAAMPFSPFELTRLIVAQRYGL